MKLCTLCSEESKIKQYPDSVTYVAIKQDFSEHVWTYSCISSISKNPLQPFSMTQPPHVWLQGFSATYKRTAIFWIITSYWSHLQAPLIQLNLEDGTDGLSWNVSKEL